VSLNNPKSEGNTTIERLKCDRRKAELEARIIRHFRAGYILILLTPFLSFAVILEVGKALTESQNYLLPVMLITELNASIVALLIIGIALYMYGYLRREARDAEAKVTLLISFFLILWGVFTYLIASGFYNDLIVRSMNPGTRALTIWDYMEYWTWELKGILGTGTGLLLAVTSLTKMYAARARARTL
jgi:hypothetical protein